METKTWFTSDTHFNHKNIIDYCKRPYRSSDGQLDVNFMNREMVRLWNETVAPFDIVYHLGDFAMGSKSLLEPMRKKLNGKIILIKGNHDRHPATMRHAGFEEVHTEGVFEWEGKKFYLAHIPVRDPHDWRGCEYHLCGHVHDLWRRRGNIINVGVDQWGLKPRSIEEIVAAVDEGPLRPDETWYEGN